MLRLRVWLVLVVLSAVFVAVEGHAGEVQRLAGRVSLKINSAVPPKALTSPGEGHADVDRRHQACIFGQRAWHSGQ